MHQAFRLIRAIALAALASSPALATDTLIQGVVKAGDETVLSAEMAGRINRLPLDEGATFGKGDLLAGFSCDILQAQRSVAVAVVEGARAQGNNAKRLDSLGVAGSLDLALAEAALRESLAELRVAEARTRLCTVLAPFPGVLLSREVEEHESVNVMTPLLKIGRRGALRIAVIAPAQWLAWLKPGASFSFVPHDGKTAVQGRIDQIGAAVDVASQTVKVEGLLESEDVALIPGMGGVVTFSFHSENKK